MFECNDDVDVDDDFLNVVFESEAEGFVCHEERPKDSRATNITLPQTNCLIRDGRSSAHLVTVNEAVTPGRIVQTHENVNKSLNLESTKFQTGCDTYSNKENKRKQVSPPLPTRSKRERKFPGPAGLLPDRKYCRGTPLKLDSILEADKSPPDTSHDELCSQGRCSGSILEEEPWQNLLADLGSDKKILEVVNVASVKRKAAAKCFLGRKVPFLAAVLHHLDMSSPDPCIILRDSTGEIHGTLHRDVWEQFAGELTIGSVIVIRNVGLLSTGVSSRRHYLNITANNLATIYSANPDKLRKTELCPFTSQDFVRSIENWQTLVRPSCGVGSPSFVASPELFNSSLSSPFTSSPLQIPQFANTSADKLSAPKWTQINKTLVKSVKDSNMSQNVQFTNNTAYTPGHPRHLLPPRGPGKNLLSSFNNSSSESVLVKSNVNNNLSDSVRSVSKVSSSNSFNNKPANPMPSKSHTAQPVVRPNSSYVQNLQTTDSSSDSFIFDPVILKPKRFSNKNFPQSNSERHSDSSQQINAIGCSTHCRNTPSQTNNSTKVVLSQASQLTADEQSLVESMFDGVDADSLFDDDF